MKVTTRALSALAVSAVMTTSLAACAGSSSPTLAGVWNASDGTATKTINDDGMCTGMYYNGTTPLDIGGGMSCTLSDSETDGYYTLVVRQPPNQTSYRVRFNGDGEMTLYSGSDQIVTLTKQ